MLNFSIKSGQLTSGGGCGYADVFCCWCCVVYTRECLQLLAIVTVMLLRARGIVHQCCENDDGIGVYSSASSTSVFIV